MTEIRLRAPEPHDIDVMMEIENDMFLWEHSSVNTGPYTRFQLKRYIEENVNNIYEDHQQRFMIETAEGEVAGMVDLFEFDARNNRAEVGIAVLPHFRRSGVAASAISSLEEHCFGFLGMKQLYSYVRTDNEEACSLFMKCGFRETGILKSWIRCGNVYYDVAVYQKMSDRFSS